MILIWEILLAFVILCLCVCLGQAVRKGYQLLLTDALIIGEMIMTGLAETAHLAAVVFGQSFSRCTQFFLLLLGIALVAAGAGCLLQQRRSRKQKAQPDTKNRRKQQAEKLQAEKSQIGKGQAERLQSGRKQPARLLTVLFAVLLLLQLITVLKNAGTFPQGDMTVETVGSFLQTDTLYAVNPVTGQPYTAGMPSRLKLLCLPTLYGIFCRVSGLQPQAVATVTVPVLAFFSCYAAFFCVAQGLFPKNRKKRICFLLLVILVMWTGSYLYGMDGFNLLLCGYRGITIRNVVLLPYLISLVIRKKWKLVPLCVLAEACMVWTFYGLGVCVLVWAGLVLAGRDWHGKSHR